MTTYVLVGRYRHLCSKLGRGRGSNDGDGTAYSLHGWQGVTLSEELPFRLPF